MRPSITLTDLIVGVFSAYYAIRTDNYFKYMVLVLIRMNSRVNEGGMVIENLDVFHLKIFYTFNIRALIATTTVLTLINTAPIAGLSMTPKLYNAPAAKGKAITL